MKEIGPCKISCLRGQRGKLIMLSQQNQDFAEKMVCPSWREMGSGMLAARQELCEPC
jgi:hypothetical protein